MFQKPKVKIYRDLVKFSNYAFGKYWFHKLSLENFSTSANGLQNVLTICVSALDNFAPRKKNIHEKTICLSWIKSWRKKTDQKSLFEGFYIWKTNTKRTKLLVIGNAITAHLFYKIQRKDTLPIWIKRILKIVSNSGKLLATTYWWGY